MRVAFTRISPSHHRFAYVRADGSGGARELESKSFLAHDFLHFCVESEAAVAYGFYGALAAGVDYGDVAAAPPETDPIWDIERAVGALTGLTRGPVAGAEVMAGLRNWYGAMERPLPGWLDAAFITRVAERYRRLIGQWRSLAFGATLELDFAAESSASESATARRPRSSAG